MKIAFVLDCIYPWRKGGGERRYYELAHALARMGHEVHLIGMQDWPGEQKHELAPGVFAVGATSPYALYGRTGQRTILDAFRFAWQFARWSRTWPESYDLIDASPFPFTYLPFLHRWARRQAAPLVLTWHDLFGPRHWLRHRPLSAPGAIAWERWSLRYGDLCVAVSEHTRERMVAAGSRKPIRVAPNGLDLDTLDAAVPAPELPRTAWARLVYAGRLIRPKRLDLVLEAAALASRTRPLEVVIVGDGPVRQGLEALASELQHVAPGLRVHFTGFLEEASEVYGVMKTSDALVHASEMEGHGIVALEAQACGLPVVVADWPSSNLRHLVQDGRNGYVCAPAADALAGGILQALDLGPEQRRQIARDMRSLGWQGVAEHLLVDVYPRAHSGAAVAAAP